MESTLVRTRIRRAKLRDTIELFAGGEIKVCRVCVGQLQRFDARSAEFVLVRCDDEMVFLLLGVHPRGATAEVQLPTGCRVRHAGSPNSFECGPIPGEVEGASFESLPGIALAGAAINIKRLTGKTATSKIVRSVGPAPVIKTLGSAPARPLIKREFRISGVFEPTAIQIFTRGFRVTRVCSVATLVPIGTLVVVCAAILVVLAFSINAALPIVNANLAATIKAVIAITRAGALALLSDAVAVSTAKGSVIAARSFMVASRRVFA